MSRSKSSRNWRMAQAADPYVKRAQAEGYRARAIYKLAELDTRYRLLHPGMRVLDLGAAPGAWSQYVKGRVVPNGWVLASDMLAMEPIQGVEFIQGDFRDDAVAEAIRTAIGQADLVISDMAPNLSGIDSVDLPAQFELAELALAMAADTLGPGGDFLVKLFQGAGFDDCVRTAKGKFGKVTIRKPAASRPHSREVYLLARNYDL